MSTKTLFKSTIGKLTLIILLISFLVSSLYKGIFENIETPRNLLRLENAFLFNYPIIAICLGIILLAFIGIYWARLAKKHKLFEGHRSILYTLIIIGVGLWPSNLIFIDNLIAVAFIIVQTGYFLTIYNQKNINKTVFYGAMFLGLAFIVYTPSIYFFIAYLIGISIVRSLELKTYLIALLGACLPIIYLYSFSFLLDLDILSISEVSNSFFINSFELQELNVWKIGYLALFLIAFFINIFRRANLTAHVSNQIAYLSLLFFFAYLLYFLNDENAIIILMVLATIFVGNFYFYFYRKWILEIGILVFLATYSFLNLFV